MRQMRFFVTLALLSIVSSFSALAQNQQRPLVIRGGLLIDGTGAAPVPNSVIVVSNGKIQAVGREGTVTIPANATIIEAGGKTVIHGRKLGQDAIMMRNRLTSAMMKTIINLAHKQGLPVFAAFDSANIRQGQPLLGTDEIVDTGLDVQVHLFGLIKATAPPAVIDRIRKGGPTQGWDQLDTNKFAPIIQKMVANKMFLNPTVAAQFERASKSLPEFDRINTDYLKTPMALGLPKGVRDRYALSFKPGPEQNAAQLAEGYKRAGLFVKQFAEAGGKLIAGTDSDAGRLGTS